MRKSSTWSGAKMRTIVLLGMVLMAVTVGGLGMVRQNSETKSTQPPEAKAKPGVAEMKRLGFYIGQWTYTETYPNGGVNHGVYTSKPGPGGNSLLNTFHSQGPVGDFEGMLVYTWDLTDGKYKAYVFGDDFPGALVETGEFEGEKLVFHGETRWRQRKNPTAQRHMDGITRKANQRRRTWAGPERRKSCWFEWRRASNSGWKIKVSPRRHGR